MEGLWEAPGWLACGQGRDAGALLSPLPTRASWAQGGPCKDTALGLELQFSSEPAGAAQDWCSGPQGPAGLPDLTGPPAQQTSPRHATSGTSHSLSLSLCH